MSIKFWSGTPPSKCDACCEPITDTFSDMKTLIGPWACLCPACAERGPGIGRYGMGLGQEYKRQRDGSWLKVRG